MPEFPLELQDRGRCLQRPPEGGPVCISVGHAKLCVQDFPEGFPSSADGTAKVGN